MEKFHSPSIVLVSPQIPPNTGNIGRLAAANYAPLHLIEPLGFDLGDRNLKRAGLDYWPEVNLHIHPNWPSFLESTNCQEGDLWILSSKATMPYHQATFLPSNFLVFGNETSGLPLDFHQRYSTRRLTIPMPNQTIRSLNLATSVGIVFYEAQRQLRIRSS